MRWNKNRNKYGETGDEITENMSLLGGSSDFRHQRMEEEEYGTEYEGNIFVDSVKVISKF